LFPANGPSADRIIPELQDIHIGTFIPDGPPHTECGLIVEELDHERALVMHSTSHLPMSWRAHATLDWSWAFVLTPLDDDRRTRFHFRSRWTTSPWWLTLGGWAGIVPADFIMSRDMLRGVQTRVTERVISTYVRSSNHWLRRVDRGHGRLHRRLGSHSRPRWEPRSARSEDPDVGEGVPTAELAVDRRARSCTHTPTELGDESATVDGGHLDVVGERRSTETVGPRDRPSADPSNRNAPRPAGPMARASEPNGYGHWVGWQIIGIGVKVPMYTASPHIATNW
jgi:hypothetical protein